MNQSAGALYLLQSLLSYGYTVEEAAQFDSVMRKLYPVKGELELWKFPIGSPEQKAILRQVDNARMN